jgi:hypothetical protein
MCPPVEEDDPNDNETLFSASAVNQDANNDNQIDLRAEMQQLKHGLSELNEVAKILLELKAELTAPLTYRWQPRQLILQYHHFQMLSRKRLTTEWRKLNQRAAFYMRKTNRRP